MVSDSALKLDCSHSPKGMCHTKQCIASEKSAVFCCDTCRGLFHAECIGIDSQTFHQFASIVHVMGWVCASYRNIVRMQLNVLQSRQTDLSATVEKLKEDVAQLKHDIFSCQQPPNPADMVPKIWPSLLSSKEHKKQFLSLVHADLDDSRRRHCNIVVSGIKPKPGASDVDLFLDLCERNLTLKPYVIRNKCRRLGRQQVGKTQPLLICLNNAETAKDLLAAAKQLRNSDDEEVRSQVYFNPDLTPSEAQAAYERRQRRRQRQGQPSASAATRDDTATNWRTGGQPHDFAIGGLPGDGDHTDILKDVNNGANNNDGRNTARLAPLNINAASFKPDERVPSLS
jgi:hypothetical protein